MQLVVGRGIDQRRRPPAALTTEVFAVGGQYESAEIPGVEILSKQGRGFESWRRGHPMLATEIADARGDCRPVG